MGVALGEAEMGTGHEADADEGATGGALAHAAMADGLIPRDVVDFVAGGAAETSAGEGAGGGIARGSSIRHFPYVPPPEPLSERYRDTDWCLVGCSFYRMACLIIGGIGLLAPRQCPEWVKADGPHLGVEVGKGPSGWFRPFTKGMNVDLPHRWLRDSIMSVWMAYPRW
jgi:hypothetical protein